MMWFRAILIGFFIFVLIISHAQAAAIRVPEDYPTVLSGIDAAVSGDSVLVGPGTWTDKATRIISIGGSPGTFTSCGFFKGGVTLIGTNGANATIIDAEASGPGTIITFIFANQSNDDILIEGVTITGGINAGLFGVDSGRITIRSCRIVGNSSPTAVGGAIRTDECDVTLEDSNISFNAYAEGTGAVSCDQAHLVARGCRFEGNLSSGAAVVATAFTSGVFDPIIEDCVFIHNRGQFGAALGLSYQDNVVVEGNLFLENVATSGMSASMLVNEGHSTVLFNTFVRDSCLGGDGSTCLIAPFDGEISNNTFYDCFVEDPSFDGYGSAIALYAQNGGSIHLEHNVFAFCDGQPAVFLIGGTNEFQFNHSCNVFWENHRGDYGGWIPTIPADIEADPLFCDPELLDLTVQEESACAAGNTPGCAQIGAWPVGCGSIHVDETSWGKIKALYR